MPIVHFLNKTNLFLLSFIIITFQALAQGNGKYVYDPYFPQQNNVNKLDLPQTEKKEIYRIDFLLPLYLDEIPQGVFKKTPKNSLLGVNFYEGVLMAIDSLEKNSNTYYDFVVHDIAYKSPNDIINNGDLEGTDLIIGVVQSELISSIANYASDKKINFISALSPSNGGTLENPFFIMVQPTLQRHIQKIINFGTTEFPFSNVLLLYSDKPNDKESFENYKVSLKSKYQEFLIPNDYPITALDIKSRLKQNTTNVIYVSALSPKIAKDVINAVKQIDATYDIKVMGMPSWKGLPELMTKDAGNVSIYVTSPFKFDEEYDKRMYIRNLYEIFDRGLPSEMVFRGFETTLMATQLLFEHGTIFNEDLLNYQSFITMYNIDIVKDNKKSPLYYENNNLYVYKFKNGILSVE